MKKIRALVLATAVVFMLCGCGKTKMGQDMPEQAGGAWTDESVSEEKDIGM